MPDVSAIGRINKQSFLLAAAGYLCVNFEIGGAGSELSKHWRHRDECLFIRHRYPIQGYWVCPKGFDARACAYTLSRAMFGWLLVSSALADKGGAGGKAHVRTHCRM